MQELCESKLHDFSSHSSYQKLKDRFLIVAHIIGKYQRLTAREQQILIDAILESDDLELALPRWLSVDSKGKGQAFVGRLAHGLTGFLQPNQQRAGDIIHSAHTAVVHQGASDLVFLHDLLTMCGKEQRLLNAAMRIGQIVREEVKFRIAKLVEKWSQTKLSHILSSVSSTL